MTMALKELNLELPKQYRNTTITEADFVTEDTITEEEIEKQPIIKSKYWELPEFSLDGWRPFTAFISHYMFDGPNLKGHGRGLSLHKDLMGGIHGSRGSGKSEFLTWLLMKKMRTGKPVWTNYPISFFVVEADGNLTYYESRPLDFNKFYAFSPQVRNGAVGITELQYYVEARTSGREQNRIATYQIMQIRKTALSFMYDVQDRSWVDKRFGWSNDFDIECSDIAKLPYDRASIDGFPSLVYDEYGSLREGAFVRLFLEDTSGVLTGTPYKKNPIEYGPYQFSGFEIWESYPTHFIIDAYEAMNSYKKKNEKQDRRDLMANSLESAINYFLEQGEYNVLGTDLWVKANEISGETFTPTQYGRQMGDWGIMRKQGSSGDKKGRSVYDIGALLE